MIYINCPLYKLQSKKILKYLLSIHDNNMLKQDYVASLISPYIDISGKPRLIEPPQETLKHIQKRIKNLLGYIDVPANVFSGIKGRSYIDNATMHIGNSRKNLFKIDLTAFFPSISRDTVYRFFFEDLCCSPDVATILTNFTTIDLEKSKTKNLAKIYSFLESKHIKCRNHLISGAPTSQILSYLVNHKMFEEMQALSDKQGITMSVYVDDITFSSENWISHRFEESIISIVRKYGYRTSKNKTKKYTKLYPKLITGVVIGSTGKLVLKNSLREKILIEYNKLRKCSDDQLSRQRLKGLLIAARQACPNVFQSIYRFAFENKD